MFRISNRGLVSECQFCFSVVGREWFVRVISEKGGNTIRFCDRFVLQGNGGSWLG